MILPSANLQLRHEVEHRKSKHKFAEDCYFSEELKNCFALLLEKELIF